MSKYSLKTLKKSFENAFYLLKTNIFITKTWYY